MIKVKCKKPNIKQFCFVIILSCIIFSNAIVFAAQNIVLEPVYTQDFIEWQELNEEEKENSMLPRISTTLISDEVLSQYNKKYTSYREQILTRNFSKNLINGLIQSVTYSSPSYNLNTDISVAVKHQGITNECWAFSTITALETNLELNRNIQKRFSPRHMDYATARTFTDGINELGYAREVGKGGLQMMGMSYLTNGQGAVLEEDMPFENNENQISLLEIDKQVDTIVTGYVSFPAIHKEYAIDNGEIVYTNGDNGSNLVIYTDEEVQQLRNIIKNHIIQYGAITAVTAGNHVQFYNNIENPLKSTAYFCNDNSIVRDHAVTIVGWDDNYPKENFTGVAMPRNDGAYITLNTYGTDVFDKGYLYISYEDALIESLLYGIKGTSDVDYDNLYQYDPYGGNLTLGTKSVGEGYIAAVYNRDVSKNEEITNVGVYVADSVSLEIYINPNGNSTILTELTKIGETEVLEPGYHRIPVKATKLLGNEFAIVIKQKSEQNRFYFAVEIGVNGTIYENITGNPGKTLYSTDGYNWKNLSSQTIVGLDMDKGDICIKAFTKEIKLSNDENPGENDDEITIASKKYNIKGFDIYKVKYSTTLKEFKENIETNSETIKVYSNEVEIADNEIVKNGMILELSNGERYTLIVRGDIDSSGIISIVDFSKLLAHYMEDPEYILTGDALKAADISCDGKISLLDISQMIVLYTTGE